MKTVCWRFHIKTRFTFWDMRKGRYVKSLLTNIQKQENMLKISLPFKNLQTSRTNNSRIFRINNAKFEGYCFNMNTNIYGDFQICISVPLTLKAIE